MSAKVTTRHHQAVAAALAEFKADWNLLDTFGQAAVLEQIIAQALADAEQAERERACAAIADYLDIRLSQSLADDLMAAIRARGTPAKEKADG